MVSIDISKLTAEEQLFSVCRSLIKIFSVSRGHRTIEQLHKDYLAVCGNVKKINEKDPTSSIRSYIGRWNKLARTLQVGCHPKGFNGCKDTGGHRICRKGVPDAGTRAQFYWLNDVLRLQLYGNNIYTVETVKNVSFTRSPEASTKKRRKCAPLNKSDVGEARESDSHDCEPPLVIIHAPAPSLVTTSFPRLLDLTKTQFDIESELDSIPIPPPVFGKPIPTGLPTPPITPNHLGETPNPFDGLVMDELFLDDLLMDIESGLQGTDSDLEFPSDEGSDDDLEFPDEL